MTQFYFDPERETDPNALPDAEVFFLSGQHASADAIENNDDIAYDHASEHGQMFDNVCHMRWFHDSLAKDIGDGWYWWACFPGCLPDGEPVGPFDSEQAAIEDAQA